MTLCAFEFFPLHTDYQMERAVSDGCFLQSVQQMRRSESVKFSYKYQDLSSYGMINSSFSLANLRSDQIESKYSATTLHTTSSIKLGVLWE